MTPTMSVKETRKLLSSDSKDLTDELVTKLVEDVELLAEIALRVGRDKLELEHDVRPPITEHT